MPSAVWWVRCWIGDSHAIPSLSRVSRYIQFCVSSCVPVPSGFPGDVIRKVLSLSRRLDVFPSKFSSQIFLRGLCGEEDNESHWAFSFYFGSPVGGSVVLWRAAGSWSHPGLGSKLGSSSPVVWDWNIALTLSLPLWNRLWVISYYLFRLTGQYVHEQCRTDIPEHTVRNWHSPEASQILKEQDSISLLTSGCLLLLLP